MEYKINTLLPVQFEKITNPLYIDDSRWQTYKVWICHDLENYNGSYFDVSTLEKMGEKLAGVPVVGYISANSINEKDFSGHEERLIIQDGEIFFEYLGRAYGCVLENNDWQIEQKEHEDGSVRNYLTCKCIVWNMFKDAIEIFERDGKKPHSMELQEGSIQGKFEKDGYFHFTDATIRALCILGEEIQPAMSNSIIEKFSQVDFGSQVQELLFEINESIKQFSSNQSSNLEVDDINFSKEEVEVVDEKLELLKKHNLAIEDISFSIDDLSLEEIESKIEEQFALLASGKQEELINVLREEKYMDSWGDQYSIYSYVDHSDSEIFAYDRQDNWNLYGFMYSMSGDKAIIDFTTKKRKKFQIIDFEDNDLLVFELYPREALEYELLIREKSLVSQFATEKEDIANQLDTITMEYEQLKPEIERLQNFEKETLENQRKEAEEILFAQFDEKLKDIKEYEQLKETASNFELDALEKECFVILGKQSANFTAKPTKKEKVKIEFNKAKNQEQEDEFGDLFDKYLKK